MAPMRAREDGVGRLGDHRQIDGDAVAFADVAVAQHVGEAADLVVQLLVGDLPGVLGIVAFPDDRRLVAALGEMAVDAVVGGVGGAVLEPFDGDVTRVEGGVLDLGEGLVPVDALRLLRPEAVGIGDRALVHAVVVGVADIGALGPLGGYFVDLVRHLFLRAHGLCGLYRSVFPA